MPGTLTTPYNTRAAPKTEIFSTHLQNVDLNSYYYSYDGFRHRDVHVTTHHDSVQPPYNFRPRPPNVWDANPTLEEMPTRKQAVKKGTVIKGKVEKKSIKGKVEKPNTTKPSGTEGTEDTEGTEEAKSKTGGEMVFSAAEDEALPELVVMFSCTPTKKFKSGVMWAAMAEAILTRQTDGKGDVFIARLKNSKSKTWSDKGKILSKHWYQTNAGFAHSAAVGQLGKARIFR